MQMFCLEPLFLVLGLVILLWRFYKLYFFILWLIIPRLEGESLDFLVDQHRLQE